MAMHDIERRFSTRRDGAWHSDEMQRPAAVSAFGLPPRALCAHRMLAAQPAPAAGAARFSLDSVIDTFQVLSTWADAVMVEDAPSLLAGRSGAGARGFDGADVARELKLPFLLVVPMGVGCVAAALSCVRSLEARGLQCAGWIANHLETGWVDEDGAASALSRAMPGPCLGSIPRLCEDTPARAARSIDVDRMMLALAP